MRARFALLLAIGCGADDDDFRLLSITIDPVETLILGAPARIAMRSDGDPPLLWTRMGTILGMSLNEEGGNEATFEGTPQALGLFSIVFEVMDSDDDRGQAVLNVQVDGPDPPPVLTIDPFPFERAIVGRSYLRTMTLMGGEPPLTWTSTLPPGLALEPGRTSITGIPEVEGAFPIEVRVEDALQRSASLSYVLQVRRPTVIETRTIPNAIANLPYGVELEAGGGERPYRWRDASQGLPPGLIVRDQRIEGQTTELGDFVFNLEVRDAWDEVATQIFYLTVSDRAADPSRALWPIPPFGRTTADFLPGVSSIIDPITAIAWTPNATNAETLADAEAHCSLLSLGEAGWRLPTRIELASIGGRYGSGFEAPIAAPYFEIWNADGSTWLGEGPGDRGALCANAAAVAEVDRYAAAYGGQLDRYTGLVWSRALSCAADHRWGAKFCAELTEQDRTDWRQPNVRELLSANGPGTLAAQGLFEDPEERRVIVDAAGAVVTGTTAQQWCVRDPRADCTGLSVSFLVEPTFPKVGQAVTLEALTNGGEPCEVQYSWSITDPEGVSGWPAYAPLQELQADAFSFVPLMAGFFEIALVVAVDGHRNLASVLMTVDASCELDVSSFTDGTTITTSVSGGVPPFQYAWHAMPHYCGGNGGYVTGFSGDSAITPPVSDVRVAHRVVVVDSTGCAGVTEESVP